MFAKCDNGLPRTCNSRRLSKPGQCGSIILGLHSVQKLDWCVDQTAASAPKIQGVSTVGKFSTNVVQFYATVAAESHVASTECNESGSRVLNSCLLKASLTILKVSYSESAGSGFSIPTGSECRMKSSICAVRSSALLAATFSNRDSSDWAATTAFNWTRAKIRKNQITEECKESERGEDKHLIKCSCLGKLRHFERRRRDAFTSCSLISVTSAMPGKVWCSRQLRITRLWNKRGSIASHCHYRSVLFF